MLFERAQNVVKIINFDGFSVKLVFENLTFFTYLLGQISLKFRKSALSPLCPQRSGFLISSVTDWFGVLRINLVILHPQVEQRLVAWL